MENKVVNVLCLHGCNQSEQMFRDLLRNYIKIGEKQNIKFYFVEGKYDHPVGGKTWFNKPLDVKEIGRILFDDSLTKDALDDLHKSITDMNITVLLGFSQGANVVDTFMTHRNHQNIKRVVLMSGYSLVDPLNKTVDVPCLTVISDTDEIVPSNLNPINYKELYIILHDKQHKLPTSNPTIRTICKFIGTGAFEK